LGGLSGGAAPAFAQARQDAQNRAQYQAALAEQIREANQQNTLSQQQLALQQQQAAAQNRTQGLDAQGNPLPGLNVPKDLSEIVTGNKGKGAPTADDYVQYYLKLSALALAQGRPDLEQMYNQIASSWGLGVERTSSAQVNVQGKLPLLQAQAAAERDLPQRAREIAGANNAAKLQAVAEQIASRQELAQYGAQERFALAQYAGALHLQGLEVGAAIAQAKETYDAQVKNYLQQTSPQAEVLNPQGAGGVSMPSYPPININVTEPNAPQAPPVGGIQPLPVTGSGRGGGAQPVRKLSANEAMQTAVKALGSGMPKATVLAQLKEAVSKGAIDRSVATQIETELGLTSTGPI
jgi:hypothetical protein